MKIKYLAVLVAAIIHWVLGGIWYGVFFKNKFIELIGWTPAQLQQMADFPHSESLPSTSQN